MNTYLPQSTVLGKLEFFEVYEYYDQPCLFSCKNLSGQIFISVWVDTKEIGDVWLYAPISSIKFRSLRSKEIDLRSIFTDSEDAFVYEILTKFDNLDESIVTVIACNEITEDYLPDPNQFIQARTHLEYEEIKEIAINKKREVLNFIIHRQQKNSNEISIDTLGDILNSIQEAIYAIGQLKEGKSQSNVVPYQIVEQTTLVTSKVFSGSFGIQIEGIFFEEDLLGESLVGRCIEELVNLINIGANPEKLQGRLNLLQKKSASKYKAFLEAITVSGATRINLEWASPTPGKGGTAEISLGIIREVIEIINNTKLASETIIITLVKVVMIHFETEKITLEQLKPKKKYQCVITQKALKDVETVSSTTIYTATIQEYVMLAPIIGKETHEYELVQLKPYNETIPLLPL